MADTKLKTAWLKGCLRGIGLQIAAGIGVFVLFGGLVGAALLIQLAFPDAMRGAGIIIALLCFVALVFGGMALYVIWTLTRRQKRYDAVFEPLGMAGSMYGIRGREYRGTHAGRRVDVLFSRGPELGLHMQAHTGTRMAIGLPSRLGELAANLTDTRTLILPDDLAHYAASAQDDSWAMSLLDDAATRAAIRRLLADDGPHIPVLVVQPEAVLLQLRYIPQDAITTEAVQTWLTDLAVIASRADSLHEPMDPIAPTGLDHTFGPTGEGSVASQRMTRAYVIAFVIIGLLLVCGAAATIITLAAVDAF